MAFSYQWSREEQRKWAEDRLFRYVRKYAGRYHPYYRKLLRDQGIDPRDIQTYDDFSKLPLTRREDLEADPRAFVLRCRRDDKDRMVEPLPAATRLGYAARAFTTRYLRDVYGPLRSFKEKSAQAALYEWQPVQHVYSAGTTGTPVSAALTSSDLHRNLRGTCGMLYATGWEPGMRTLSLLPSRPRADSFALLAAAFALDTGAPVLQVPGGGGVPGEREVIAACGQKPEALISRPGYLLFWLKTALELKERDAIEGLPGVELVVSASEPLTAGLRERLSGLLAGLGSPEARIVEFYGMAEMKTGFFECDEGMGFHLNPEFFYWEVLDLETGEPVNWGEPGVLAFSHIDWRGTALLRYWTGDLVSGGMVWEKCPSCGLTLPRVFAPVVRAEEDCLEVRGSRLSRLAFQRALHGVAGLDSFQVEVGGEEDAPEGDAGTVTVYACGAPGAGEEDLRRRMAEALTLEVKIAPDDIVFAGPGDLGERLLGGLDGQARWVADRRGTEPEPVEEPPSRRSRPDGEEAAPDSGSGPEEPGTTPQP